MFTEDTMTFKAQPPADPAIHHMTTLAAMAAFDEGNISEGEAIFLFQGFADRGIDVGIFGAEYQLQMYQFVHAGLVTTNRLPEDNDNADE